MGAYLRVCLPQYITMSKDKLKALPLCRGKKWLTCMGWSVMLIVDTRELAGFQEIKSKRMGRAGEEIRGNNATELEISVAEVELF